MIAFRFRQKGRRIWRCRYRVGDATQITEVSLHTPDKRVAAERLRDLVRELEREAAGIISPRLQRNAAQRNLLDHLEDYVRDLTTLGRDSMYIYNIEKRVSRLIAECGWNLPKDVTPDSFQQWRAKQTGSPKTLNEYLASISAMLNWMIENGRLLDNSLRSVRRAETNGQEKRKRRALTDDEVRRLLSVAGKYRIAYLAGLLTGLRRNELAQLLWSDLCLDAPKTFLKARASTTKNHQDVLIALHEELTAALRKLRPASAAPDALVFPEMPSMYILKKHLKAANISYKDVLDRQADFHALRHTFGTNLSRAGVLPRVAMEAMRHSDIRLTMKFYTDVSQLPTAAAIDSLPGFNTQRSQ